MPTPTSAFPYSFVIVDVKYKAGIPRGSADVEEVYWDQDWDEEKRGQLKPFHFIIWSSYPTELNRDQKMEAISKFVGHDLTIIF